MSATQQGQNMDGITLKQSNIPAMVGAIGAALTTGGPTYAFGLYGAALKKNLGLSQSDIDTISTAFFVAGLLSWAPGLFADRFGARLAICIGGITGCVSLMLYWCIAKQFIVIDNHFLLVALLSLLGVFTFESSAMVTGAVFKVLTVISGTTKGTAVGVAKGLVGLGSGVYTCIFESLKTSNESDLDFLPLAAVLFLCCATTPSFFLIPSRKELQSSDNFTMDARPWHFRSMYCGLLGMGLLIIWDSLAELFRSDEKYYLSDSEGNDGDDDAESSPIRRSNRSPGIAVLLFILWWGPLVTIYCSHRLRRSGDESVTVYRTVQSQEIDIGSQDDLIVPASASDDDDNESSRRAGEGLDTQDMSRLLTAEDGADSPGTENSTGHAPILAHSTANHPDRNLLEMLQTPEAFCLLWTATIMVGSGKPTRTLFRSANC